MNDSKRHVLITGGANGIGRGLSRAFAREGYSVYLADIDKPSGEQAASEIANEGGEAEFIPMNVGEELSIRDAMSKLSNLDVLINNAAVFPVGSLERLPVEDWDRTFQVGLRSAYLCTKYAISMLRRSGNGAVINISSINAFSMSPGLPAYAAAKGGLNALTRQLAVEYGQQRIRFNSISPGFILTEQTGGLISDPLELEMTLECYPVGRLGTVDDVAYAALFLASERAGFINGADLVVDGGMSAQSSGALIKPSLRRRYRSGTMRLERTDS